MQYVFVYGTLKKGQPNHYLLENEENGKKIFCGKALSKKKFPLIVACRYNIPYVLDAAGQGKVIEGEIYKYVYPKPKFLMTYYFRRFFFAQKIYIHFFVNRVDENMLGHLDILEDHPNHYTRTPEEFVIKEASNETDLKSGDVIEAAIYILKNFKEELLRFPTITSYSSTEDPKYVKR